MNDAAGSVHRHRSTDDESPPVTTVFYDGGCSLCRREIDHYRKLDASAAISWVDVATGEHVAQGFSLNTRAAMQRFHVLGSDGRWHTGAWGFAELWRHFPVYRRLAWVLKRFHLLPLTDRLYTRFAEWRWRRRCKDGICGVVQED